MSVSIEHRKDEASTSAADAPPATASNYLYWQQEGAGWADEYDARKRTQPFYHIQELMLADYMVHHAPCRVLEFGCGPGRHLRNLSRLPGVDAFGFDQSPTMTSGCRRWASDEWLAEHLRLGSPTGPLPFADDTFDIVYTSEVLLHIRPEDIQGRIAELVRICRGHLLHIEPAETYGLVTGEHSGCWHHDYVGIYRELGLTCELLPAGCAPHRPYRATKGAAPRWTWSPVMLELYRRLERDLRGQIDALNGEVHDLKIAREESRAAIAVCEQTEIELRSALVQAQEKCAALVDELRWAHPERQRLEQELGATTARADSLAAELVECQADLTAARAALAGEREVARTSRDALRRRLRAALQESANLDAQQAQLTRRWFDALES